MESILKVGFRPRNVELVGLFRSLVHLETELWNRVEVAVQQAHGVPLAWLEIMQVVAATEGCRRWRRGRPDPMKAIEKTVFQRGFDEIILSTLPPGISRWLAWDLPHRVRARTDDPLTVITSLSSAAERSRPRSHRR